MSVRVSVTVIVEDGYTIEGLKDWVALEDRVATGRNEDGISVEHVKAEDVLHQLFTGDIHYQVADGTMEEL